jgi:excisionase family DNA binding protein
VSEQDQERLLTARELASQLGVSTGALLRWTRRGDVPAFKLPGGAIRYRAADVEAWLQTRSTLKRD